MATTDPSQTANANAAQTLTPNPAATLDQTNTQASTTTTAPAASMPTQTMQGTPPGTITPASNGGAAQIASSPNWNNTADQTVNGQVQGIIAQNSPLIQQARTSALQGMNSRGLLNSSMAQTAGDSAAYSAAMPIAQADAAQASRVAGTNVANTNADIGTNLNAQNTAANLATQVAAQKNIADIEAQYKELTQGSASAAAVMTNAQNQIQSILGNTNITDKASAIADVKANVQNSMQMIGSLAGNVDLGSYVNQTNQPQPMGGGSNA